MIKFLLIVSLLLSSACGEIHSGRNSLSDYSLIDNALYIEGDLAFDPDSQPFLGSRAVESADWKKYDLKKTPFNKIGRNVLWIKIKLSDEKFSDPVLFFPAGSVTSLFEIYSGKNRVYTPPNYLLQEKSFFNLQPLVIDLPPDADKMPVYLKFETVHPGHVGVTSPIYFSSEKLLLKNIINSQADRLILGFIFIFSGLVSLLIFFKNRRGRFYGLLAFSIMSISFGMLVVFASDIVVLFYVAPRIAYYITLLAIIYFPVGIFLFIDQMIGPGYKKLIRRSWQIFLILSVFALISIITGIRLPMFYIVVLKSVILSVSLIVAVAELIRGLSMRSFEARMTSTGLLIFAFAALIDEIAFHNGSGNINLVAPWGYFIMMNMLGFILYRTFELSQKKLKAYSAELEDKSQILQDLNRTLEERVQDRTRELSDANSRLNDTNRILADRNRVIENEIEMARRIQQQLIPGHDISENICSIYNPMELVGGDFFDYINLGQSKTGIFISDVSGHGIPAALITSMLKTIIVQNDTGRHNPSQLIRTLNELLYGKTADNFVTAFYCIIDFADRSMVYCNAGHNNPLIIGPQGVSEIQGARSLPIGAMSNSFLESKGREYVNSHVTLPEDSMLLLYTDGLTEAVNINSRGVMFEEQMREFIETNKFSDVHSLVHGLYRELKAFRGGETFDDDVCIIGIES